MSILDINVTNQKVGIKKTLIVYVIVSILVFLTDKIYGQFGHGIYSDYMTWMFLYPLVGGVLFYAIIVGFLFQKTRYFKGYRIFYNLYNSGIATLTMGSFLMGVFEIAGAASDYSKYFFMVGYGFIAVSIFFLIILTLGNSPERTN